MKDRRSSDENKAKLRWSRIESRAAERRLPGRTRSASQVTTERHIVARNLSPCATGVVCL